MGKEVAKLGRNDEVAAFQVADDLSLGELEEVIGDNLDAFIAVGVALGSIRDRQLWKESHDSFAAYCSERWGLSRSAAWRRIAQAQESVGAGERKPQRVSRAARQVVDSATPDGSIEVTAVEVPKHNDPAAIVMAVERLDYRLLVHFKPESLRRARDVFVQALRAQVGAEPKATPAPTKTADQSKCPHSLRHMKTGACLACGHKR